MSISSFFGFKKSEPVSVLYPDNFSQSDNIDEKLEYLKAMVDDEDSRMRGIEAKTGQLIGMTSVVFSLLGIFVANYLSKLNSLPLWLQIMMMALFVVSLFFYINTIFQGSKYLEVSKHWYGQRSVSTVRMEYKDANAIKLEEAKDLIYIVEKNAVANNEKATYLSNGYGSFKLATLGIAVLSFVMLFAGKFYNSDTPTKVVLTQAVELSHLDSSLKNSIPVIQIPRIVIVHDTVYRSR